MVVRIATLTLSLLIALATHASAGAITWSGDAGCGDAAALESAVVAHGGKVVAVAVSVDAADSGGLIARVELETADGVDLREVRGADCATVIDAVVFVVVTALDEVVEPAPAPEAEPTREAPAPDVEVVEVRAQAPWRSAVGLRVGAAAVVETGALPGVGGGARAALVINRRRYAGELRGAAHLPRRAAIGGSMVGADVRLIAGHAAGCVTRGALTGCAGGAVGRMTGEGVGVPDARAAVRRWSAVELGVRWHRSLAATVAVTAGLDVQIAIDRPRFVLDGGMVVHQPAAAGVTFSLGLELPLL